MAELNSPVHGFKPHSTISILFSITTLYVLYLLASTIYNAYFATLSKYPGPRLWALSRIPRLRVMVRGDEGRVFADLHARYGPIVRVSPDELSLASGAQAWKDIYGFKKSGEPHPYKDKRFYGENVNKVPSIITANDPNHGRQRKILSHAFSDKALKEYVRQA